jgi:hypothetical protein
MPRHYSNGLGIAVVSAILAVTPLVPVAVSAPQPEWYWDSEGKVHDASGMYRTMTDDEACTQLGLCKGITIIYPGIIPGAGGDSGGGGSK